ncbi:MAG: hypothetical protein JW940_31070 [Polyangiaceae bacterium]|nr:hypothetical protein [Polyangiaceae bacterium]
MALRAGAKQLFSHRLARLAGATAANLNGSGNEENADATLIDRGGRLRHAHHRASIKRPYAEYRGAALSERSCHLLQTRHAAREVHR